MSLPLPHGPWALILFEDPAGLSGGWWDADLLGTIQPNLCWGFGLLRENGDTILIMPFGNSLDQIGQPMAIPRGCVVKAWELRKGKVLELTK